MDLYRQVRALYELLPRPVIDAVGRSRVLQPIRDLVLRPHGELATSTREIAFEDLRFEFTAPFRTLALAERRGIEASMCRLLRSGYRPGTLAVDVGANFGFVTCVLGRAGAAVLAIECNSAIIPALRQNAARVSAEVLDAKAGDGTGGTIRLDDRIARATSVIKIDTDGTEVAVLEGARAVLERDRPLLVIETNGQTTRIVAMLRAIGYEYFAGVKGELFDQAENLVAYTRPIIAPPGGQRG